MDATTTRRALLKAATGAAAYGAGVTTISVGAIVATAHGTAEAATPATDDCSPELRRLIREYDRAAAAAKRFYNSDFNAKVDAANKRYLAIPHVTAENRPGAFPAVFTTENSGHVARCQSINSVARARQSQEPGWQITYKAARRIVAGVKQRERAWQRIRRETGLVEAEAMEDRIITAEDAALAAVENFPAAGPVDMLTKYHLMADLERENGIIVDMLVADLARLANREA